MVAGSEFFSCKERLSVMSFSMVARWFCLGTLPLLLTLSSLYEYGVEASVTFAFNGFSGLSDVYTVEQDYQVWTYNKVNYSITLQAPSPFVSDLAGRFLYPMPVQMTDTLNPTVVKSFSTTFVFQILITSFAVGPGLAFIMVPDNITIGGNGDYMGLITATTADTNKTSASDEHTVGVELDTYMNVEFNDPNKNHVCIVVASMNSTESNTFIPTIPLATENPERFQQVWIDYDQADSRMTIYHAQYGQPKPTAPIGSQVGVNMSVMKEYMYLGFSSSYGYTSSNLHTILAWSFSNEGEAPQIRIGKDVGSLPPASPPPPRTPTPPGPSPNMSLPSGPIPAPVSPPPSVPPPHSSPTPVVISPPLRSPTPAESNPPSPGAPSPPSPSNTPPPPIFSPIPGPNTPPSGGSATVIAVGVVGGVFGIIALIVSCYWWYRIRRRRKFHIFISHTAGECGSKKNFPVSLYGELKKNPCYEVFIDRYELPLGTPFPDEIMKEIRKFEAGMGVGIMVVTREFFEKRWPMIELVEFLNLQEARGSSHLRILPLFLELKPDDIKEDLEAETWEAGWSEMSTIKHPVNEKEYADAVAKLCNINGVVYRYDDRSFEAEYIQVILEEVKGMYDEMHVVS